MGTCQAEWKSNSQEVRFQEAFVSYSRWRKKNKIRSYTTKPFVKKTWLKHKYPQISQNVVKGAALRNMVTWVSSVCDKHTTTTHDRLRALMFRKFVEADKICRDSNRNFKEKAEEFNSALETALVSYNALAAEAACEGKQNWKILPKHHAATHWMDHGANPRYAACHQDEDFVRGIGDENGQSEGRELVGIRPKELAGIQRANRWEAWNGGGSVGGSEC